MHSSRMRTARFSYRQTGVKTLPCPKLCLRVVTIMNQNVILYEQPKKAKVSYLRVKGPKPKMSHLTFRLFH